VRGRLLIPLAEGERIAEAVMVDAPARYMGRNAAEVRLNRLLNLILESAVEALGFDAATVIARQEPDVATIAATDQRFIALDEAQYATGEGPGLDALDGDRRIWLDDAAEVRHRWAHFANTAADIGVHSSLSIHLPLESEVAASLNLYSRGQMALSVDLAAGTLPVAEQLVAAIESADASRSTATLVRDLAESTRSRAVIEQAKGMLMADARIAADAAYEQLVQLSQNLNIALPDAAHRIVEQRSKPD
jgi:ANTAR domain/GAF domain